MEKNAAAGYTMALRLTKNGVKCFGPGLNELLGGVERTGSLRSAAKEMGMAYSKAWRIMGDAEGALGFPLLEKKTGGVHGGGATLTKKARELIAAYDDFQKDMDRAAEAALNKHFGGLL